jgi:tetratricopeptide (TPR) repeat protein
MNPAANYEEIILNSNKAAIQLLKIDDFHSAKPYLDTSLQILSSKKVKNSRKLLPITLNNYGCYFKRLGYLKESLEYFKKALEKSDYRGVTETFLNIANVFYQSENYQDALKAALKALDSIRPGRENSKTTVQVYQMLGSLYKNLGLLKEAQSMFLKGLIIGQKVLGNANKLTKSLEKEFEELRKAKSAENPSKNTKKNTLLDEDPLNHQLIHDFIPMPVDYSDLYSEIPDRTLKNYEIKADVLSPLKNSRIMRGVSQKYYKFQKIPAYHARFKKRKEVLTPIPRRAKLSLSSPRFPH